MSHRLDRFAVELLLIAFGVVQLAVVVWLTHLAPRAFYDLDLHYFAAVLERTGTYVNLPGIQELAREAGRVVPFDGVYGTPILVALLYLPMTALSLSTAHTVWNVVMVAAPIIAMRKAVGSDRWPLWLLLLTTSHSMLCVFNLANVSVLSFALATYAFGALRQGQGTRAAVCIGISAALKAYPAFLLLVFVAHRRWRELGISLAVIAVMGIAAIFALGFDDVAPAVRATLDVGGFVHVFDDDASIPGLIVAYTRNSELASMSNYVLLILGTAFILKRHATRPHVTLAMTALTMLMVQSLTWRHYFPLTIIALLALRDLKTTRPEWVRASIGFVFSNGLLTLLLAPRLEDEKASSVLIAGTLLLLATLTVASRREQRETAGALDEQINAEPPRADADVIKPAYDHA